jgi:hypothetical protein
MRLNRPGRLVTALLSALAMGGLGLAGAGTAGASTTIPIVTVHVSSTHVRLSTGTTLHAGRVIYRVVTTKGDHGLQVARLHRGYTLQEAGQDLDKAFSGDVQAIRRVDSHITFRGGAEARPNRPGRFSITLASGTYLFVDQNSNAHTFVTVVGARPKRPIIPAQGSITAYSYGWGVSNHLPANGWIRLFNQSDQPHFLEVEHVAQRTTDAMVRRVFSNCSESGPPPSWLLKANTSSGTITPYFGEKLHVNLPAGKYLIACFWPDDDTGMPHACMGMWKLVQLS